jgi:hypothetical protein
VTTSHKRFAMKRHPVAGIIPVIVAVLALLTVIACGSAGTLASITSFMNTHLAGLGWVAGSGGAWTKSGFTLNVQISSATNWVIFWHDPDFRP